MPRVRKIKRSPIDGTNFYLVDACFLANRYISSSRLSLNEQERIRNCNEWWTEIFSQLEKNKAIVFIPDICIAEAFKVLAKKYFKERIFTKIEYFDARKKLSRDIRISPKALKSANRKILFHDISTSRDVIISVDRFLEAFMKHRLHRVSLPDLIILSTAKYLIDFYKIQRNRLYIITTDAELYKGSRLIKDIPTAFDPTRKHESSNEVFID